MSGADDPSFFADPHGRLSDYNLDRPPPSEPDTLTTLPALYYRQSQQYAPSAKQQQPLPPSPPPSAIASTSVRASARLQDPFRGSSKSGGSPDPYEFYRQQNRDTTRRAGSTGGHGDDRALGRADNGTADAQQSRYPTSARRSPVSTRASRLESRYTSGSPSRKPSIPPIQTKRSGPNLQALVAKFNQSDETPSLPANGPLHNPTSNASPSGSDGTPRSFRGRLTADGQSNGASPINERAYPISSSRTRKSPSMVDKRRDNYADPRDRAREQHSERNQQSSTVGGHAYASQSITDLSPRSSQHVSRKLLFGEVTAPVPNESGLSLSGRGSGRRRGSEGMAPTWSGSERERSDTEDPSPSSPSAWYKGVTPSLEGIDLSKPVPSRPSGLHRRSYSEAGPVLGPIQVPKPSSNSIAPLSPTIEQDTPDTSPRVSKGPSQSRIPVSARRPSGASQTERPTFSRENTAPTPPNDRPSDGSRSTTPRTGKYTRDLRSSPRRQQGPQLAAFITDPTPLRSPPLRSSRPRQPVSTATTSASRARVAATINTRNSPADKPGTYASAEGGNVDLAARRERIQRAFTTKIKEREIQTERKRQSLILEARMQKGQDASGRERSNLAKDSATSERKSIDEQAEDVEASPARERTLTIRTGEPDGKRTIKITDEDSPTLGNAPLFPAAALQEDSSDADSSSGTSGSNSTTFEDAQTPLNESSRDALTSPQERILSPGSQRRTPGVPLSGEALQSMDLRDLESIQIMLQDTPTPASETDAGTDYMMGYDPQRRSHTPLRQPGTNGANLGQASITASSLTDTSRGSVPTSASTAQGPWSPEPPSTITSTASNQEYEAFSNRSQGSDSLHESHAAPQPSQGYSAKLLNKSLPNAPLDDRDRGTSSGTLQTPAITHLKRASASLNDPDDWANTSPSMLDWIHHQALDTPIDERPERPFVPPKPGADAARRGSPRLPDIQRIGGLGIDMAQGIQSASPYYAGGSNRQASQPMTSSQEEVSRDDLNKQGPRSAPLASGISAEPPSLKRPPLVPAYSGDASTRPSSDDQSHRRSITDTVSTEQPSLEKSSISITESSKSSIEPSEQKRLVRRRNILKELIDTESSFGQDMTVVVDIYKGTSNVILNSSDDVKTLFGNSADVVQFSTTFLDSLKLACKSVYVLPKSKRWKSKRDSSTTSENGMNDDQTSTSNAEMNDEERDRLTTVGTAFDQNMTMMEKVYTEYLKNHDAANQRLSQLQKSEKVKIWLKECRAYAHDLTTAWDLDSLLVKPVQRILKYPLLLKELLEVTPENHPDFVALDTAAREMVGLSKRINEAKRRADLVEQVNSATTQATKPSKKKESEGRLALSKAFGRRSEKKEKQQPVVAPENVQDRAYNAVADKFGSHFFQLQVVMRDVEMYVTDCQNWVNKLNEFVLTIEAYMDVGQTGYTEIESRWRKFRQSMRDMQMMALVDHIAAVRKHVIDPMTALLKLHDGPQRLMEKRKKRIGEYARYKAIRDRGEKPDKKTTDQGEQFVAVNDTLKDELPKLFALTGKLVEACLQNFVQLQMQWLNVWKAKLRHAIDASGLPESFNAIYDQFSGDFRYAESQVLSLGLCNGALLADTANFVNFLAPDPSRASSTTMNDDASSRRPSYATEDSRSRTASMSTYDTARSRGATVGTGVSPAYPSPDFGRAADGSSAPTAYPPPLSVSSLPPNSGRRVRASSVASRSPATPDIPGGGYRNYPPVATSQEYAGRRPVTSTGRGGFDNPATVHRPSYDGHHRANDRLHPDSEAARYANPPGSGGSMGGASGAQRLSGVFSSAMPMSESPRSQSPAPLPGGTTDGTIDPANVNVLFLAASVYEFNIDRARREAGYPYLTYVAGEIFDVIGEKGELWLAKNQDDSTNQIGWIWNKHFAKLAS